MCALIADATARVYHEDDNCVIVENHTTMTPMLVARKHTPVMPNMQIFAAIRKVAVKLFGEDFALIPSALEDAHFCIRVSRFEGKSKQQSVI